MVIIIGKIMYLWQVNKDLLLRLVESSGLGQD